MATFSFGVSRAEPWRVEGTAGPTRSSIGSCGGGLTAGGGRVAGARARCSAVMRRMTLTPGGLKRIHFWSKEAIVPRAQAPRGCAPGDRTRCSFCSHPAAPAPHLGQNGWNAQVTNRFSGPPPSCLILREGGPENRRWTKLLMRPAEALCSAMGILAVRLAASTAARASRCPSPRWAVVGACGLSRRRRRSCCRRRHRSSVEWVSPAVQGERVLRIAAGNARGVVRHGPSSRS
jgi:hypothetical protein